MFTESQFTSELAIFLSHAVLLLRIYWKVSFSPYFIFIILLYVYPMCIRSLQLQITLNHVCFSYWSFANSTAKVTCTKICKASVHLLLDMCLHKKKLHVRLTNSQIIIDSTWLSFVHSIGHRYRWRRLPVVTCASLVLSSASWCYIKAM